MPKKKLWETRWKVTSSPTKSGGQGVVYFVENATETTGGVFVLKELKQQNDVERRSRMRREVVALETLPHHSVPKFIESNADKYEDLSVKLYAVFEYIPGPTLGDFVKCCAETIGLNDAIAVVDGILNVVEFYHSNGVGHRDIKPANIILRDGQCSDPILLDFGLTFNTNDEEDHITWDGQSVGNRFLGLPEHTTTSVNKRDLRSDITFCVGLMFYLMTGTDPSILSDHNNQLPHQRPGPRSKLELIPEPKKYFCFTCLIKDFD